MLVLARRIHGRIVYVILVLYINTALIKMMPESTKNPRFKHLG